MLETSPGRRPHIPPLTLLSDTVPKIEEVRQVIQLLLADPINAAVTPALSRLSEGTARLVVACDTPSKAKCSETLLPGGALNCLNDRVRTSRFVEAINAHLQDIRASDPAGKLRVIDAGCGPLPILGIAAALLDENTRVTCIEGDPVSSHVSRSLIDSWNLSDRVDIVETDARFFDPPEPVHMVISETMVPGLGNECFTQIFRHYRSLSDERKWNTRIVPENVILRAAVADRIEGQDDLATGPWNLCCDLKEFRTAQKVEFAVPGSDSVRNSSCVAIQTEVELHAGRRIALAPDEASITQTIHRPIELHRNESGQVFAGIQYRLC